jgi:hypothetical protein
MNPEQATTGQHQGQRPEAATTRGGQPGTTTTCRVDRPDGTSTEVVRHDDGDITVTRADPDGVTVETVVVELEATGMVTVTSVDPDGTRTVLDPASSQRQVNPYGTTIDEVVHDGLVTMANTFDDEGNFRSVTMRGDWGEQTLDLRPDGARTLRWTTPFHHGTRSWDSWGKPESYEVTFSDGTSHRRGGDPS